MHPAGPLINTTNGGQEFFLSTGVIAEILDVGQSASLCQIALCNSKPPSAFRRGGIGRGVGYRPLPRFRSPVVKCTPGGCPCPLSGLHRLPSYSRLRRALGPDLTAKRYADLEAKKIKGVRGVINQLQVEPSPRFNADIAQDVRQRLIDSESIESYGLRANVQEGVMTLTGTVTSFAESQQAELLAGEIRGVNDVINHLTVDFPTVRSDDETQQNVAGTVRRDVADPGGRRRWHGNPDRQGQFLVRA